MHRTVFATLFLPAALAAPASAQIDPMLFIKDTAPHVLFAIDTSLRMQQGPSNPAAPDGTTAYYDPFVYPRGGGAALAWETNVGVSDGNTNAASVSGKYRRRYENFAYTSLDGDRAAVSSIQIVGDKEGDDWTYFDAPTRLAVARAAMYQAIIMNEQDVQFGLVRMRQASTPSFTRGNYTPVRNNGAILPMPTDAGSTTGRWTMTRAIVTGDNSSSSASGLLVTVRGHDDSNDDVRAVLARDPRTAGALVPAGTDDSTTIDAPINNMLIDAKAEASRFIETDVACTNTVVVLIVGGGEGTISGNPNLATTASGFLNVARERRVPIHVVAIAPISAADRMQLRLVAARSGGRYTEITESNISAAYNSPGLHPSPVPGTILVPELVAAINLAIQHGFADYADLNAPPTEAQPLGPLSELQVTSPVVGTVNLDNAKDINGVPLANTIVRDKSGNVIPQRSNLLLTTALVVPGATAALRAFRSYVPVADATQRSGFMFKADGTRLWIASVPADPSRRNLYTATADGTLIPFNTAPANLAILAGLMNLGVGDAAAVITAVRNAPLGPIVDSTPAIMNPPSIDPPPDNDYPAFADANKNRRSVIWVGTNSGILEGIDARVGVEVWGFIPMNLLPKLRAIPLGQGLTQFQYFVDGSARVADVKVDGRWRTHLIVGEAAGGLFYQSLDVTLDGFQAALVSPEDDDIADVLGYFAVPGRIAMNWAFPKYSSFDPTLTVYDPSAHATAPYGDLKESATAIEKTVGQTWSHPVVGQIANSAGPFAVLVGSGFMPRTTENQLNRGSGAVRGGTTFYALSAKDGTVYASVDVGNDGQNEDVDDCSQSPLPGERRHHGKKKKLFACNKLKNALQSDLVATGPPGSPFIARVYAGDLDGRVWRFEMNLDASTHVPRISGSTLLWESGHDQPIFGSMASVTVGGTNQFVFFGTGSDQLPSTDVDTTYHLVGVLDTGTSVGKTLDHPLEKAIGRKSDEKVTAFAALAGDVVFFTTTTFRPSNSCKDQDANLYAFTFVGGAAYDSTGDGAVDNNDQPLVKRIAGARATAPFVVDQHLVFGAASTVAVFGDIQDFNNGVGQAGIRILSWREVR
jgi:hypothetical protein